VGAKISPALKGIGEIARLKKERKQSFPILHHRFIALKHNEHEISQLQEFGLAHQFDMTPVRTLSIIDGPHDIHSQSIPCDQNLRAYEYKNQKLVERNDYFCETAFIFPSVFVDGTVVACDQDYKASQAYGTLSDGSSFADIWWSKESAKTRNLIKNNPTKFSFCINCPFKDRLVTDCSIERFDFHKMPFDTH
jgi:radical SAM protein with 4Fe4S-binding SPASM domain